MKHSLLQKPLPKPEPLIVNERDAARYLSISPRSLFTLRASGRIPYVKLGGAIRYAVKDLTDFVDRNRLTAE